MADWLGFRGWRRNLRDSESLAVIYRRRARDGLEIAGKSRLGEKRTTLIDLAQTWLRMAQEQEASVARGPSEQTQPVMQQQQQVQPRRDKTKE
jgi:hypothetical protein